MRLRLEHPRWGPNRTHAHLQPRPALRGLSLPTDASIGRYLHQWARFRRPKAKVPARPRPAQPSAVQQRWQIDFKLGIALREGTLLNLHTLREVVGEVCLGAFVFAAGRIGQPPSTVTFEPLRAVLRRCFARWGTLPSEVQTDRETVLLGRVADPFPSLFTLWLKGLGIDDLVIRPGEPTENAEVERCHRTINDYAIIGNEGASLEQLQALLDQAVHELAFELASHAEGCRGQPPVVAHPELLRPRRPFQPAQELACFDLRRVDAYLASRAGSGREVPRDRLRWGDATSAMGVGAATPPSISWFGLIRRGVSSFSTIQPGQRRRSGAARHASWRCQT